MSAQPPPPPQKTLMITNPQFALCLVEFLKDLPREKLVINDEGNIVEYKRQEVLETLLNWARLNLPSFPVESVNDIPRLEFFNQLTESIFNSFYKKPEGAIIPENLRQLVRDYTAQESRKSEGVNLRGLEKLSVKEMVENAIKIQGIINETANRKLSPEFPEAVREINEQVFEKTINHYIEKGVPPEAQVLQQIVKEVINKNPAASFIFTGKTEVAGKKAPRISAVVQRLEPVTKEPSFKQAANAYQGIRNTTDLQCSRTNLTAVLQSWGFTPRQTLEFLNHLETFHPDTSLVELRENLDSFMHTKKLVPDQEKQIALNIRFLKRYLELSPNIYHGDNVFLTSSEVKNRANKWGLSTRVLGAFGLGLTEERIDQELQRPDLSEAEKNNLKALKESLKEAREKTKIEDVSEYVDKRIKKRGLWQKPEGFYFYRQPPTPPLAPEKPIVAFFKGVSKPIRTVVKKSILRGLGKVRFQRLPGLKKLGWFKPKATIKKKIKFWVAKRVIGGLLIKSGSKLLGKLGKTIIKEGFKQAIIKGVVFVVKKAAQYAVKRMAESVLWRMVAWLLGAIVTNMIPGIGQIVSLILVTAGILDFVWSAIKFVKELISKKPKMLAKGELGVAEATARVLGGPTSLLGLLKGFFRPKTYAEAGGLPLETALSSLSTAAVLAVIGIILIFMVVFNPFTSAFVTLYTAYKAYKGFENLVATNVEKAKNVANFLKNAGNIALNNLNLFPAGTAEANTDEFYNKLIDLGFTEDQAEAIIENTKKYGHLQCVILATTLFNTMHPEAPIPILASPKEYYPDPPSGFRNVTSVDEIGPGTLVVVPPRKSGCDCQADIYCCGHMYVILDVEGNEIVTAHAEGSTGEVYIKNLPHPKILSDVDLNKYIIPE